MKFFLFPCTPFFLFHSLYNQERMTTVPEHIKQAQNNYLKGIATDAEKELLEQWFQQQEASVIEVLSPHRNQEARTRNENFAAITRQLNLPATTPSLSIIRALKPATKVAAAVILLAGSAGICYYTGHAGKTGSATTATTATTATAANTTTAPGSAKATLTLFNGTTIILDPAQKGWTTQQGHLSINLSQTGSLTIKKRDTQIGNADATLNTLTVPYGGEFKMELPDGSSVRLNAGSRLRFPAAFTGTSRVVELEGEAFFDVAPGKNMPFHVKTGSTDINVLGTRFNISAYKGEAATTTLLSGSVKVSTAGTTGTELQPGQQATLLQNGHVQVTGVDTADAIGWMNNLFVFNELPLNVALAQIARRFNLTIQYENGIPDIVLNGSFPRNRSLAETLELLRKLNVHFREKNGIMVVLH